MPFFMVCYTDAAVRPARRCQIVVRRRLAAAKSHIKILQNIGWFTRVGDRVAEYHSYGLNMR
jgi:hypothetical protein